MSIDAYSEIYFLVNEIPSDREPLLIINSRGSDDLPLAARGVVRDETANELLFETDFSDIQSMTLSLEDRIDNEIRVTFEASGASEFSGDATRHGHASFSVLMIVPEPNAWPLALLALTPVAALRKRGRRCV